MRGSAFAAAAACAAVFAGPAAAEVQIGLNAGWNKTLSSDVHFSGPGGVDFTVAGVKWDGLSFPNDGGAPYYGMRAAYWFQRGPGFGLMLDFTHAKVRADPATIVALTGATGAGGPAPGPYPVAALFDTLEFTDGINFITLNAMYRFRESGRLTPYVGAGAGVSRPHVEVDGAAIGALPVTSEYRSGGFTAQALIGADVRIAGPLSAFAEYRLNYSPVDASLSNDAFEIETDLVTNQVLFGLSVHFGE